MVKTIIFDFGGVLVPAILFPGAAKLREMFLNH